MKWALVIWLVLGGEVTGGVKVGEFPTIEQCQWSFAHMKVDKTEQVGAIGGGAIYACVPVFTYER